VVREEDVLEMLAEQYPFSSESEVSDYLGLSNNINIYTEGKDRFTRILEGATKCYVQEGYTPVRSYVDDGNFLNGPSQP